MRKTALAIIAPVLAGATIVGSGFAIWEVGNQDAVTNINDANVKVEGKTTIGTLTTGDVGTITLDQSNKADNPTAKGITYVNPDKRTDALHVVETYAPSTEEGVDLNGFAVEITFAVVLNSDLAKYVTFDTLSYGDKKVNDYVSGTGLLWFDPADSITEVITMDLSMTFKYVNEPKNDEEYDAFKNVVDGLNAKNPAVNVTFNAKVVEKK